MEHADGQEVLVMERNSETDAHGSDHPVVRSPHIQAQARRPKADGSHRRPPVRLERIKASTPTGSRRASTEAKAPPPKARGRFEVCLWLTLLFFGAQLVCEIVLRVNMDVPFFAIGLLHMAMFAFTRSIALAVITALFPPGGRNPFVTAVLVFYPFIYSSQLIYYKFFRTFFVFYSIGEGGQLAEFLEDIILKVLRNLPWILVMCIPLVVYLAVLKLRYFRRAFRCRRRWRDLLICCVAILVSFGITIACMAFNREYSSPWEHYFQENDILLGTHQLGLMTAMGVDISHLIVPREAVLDPDLVLPSQTTPSTEAPIGPSGAPEPSETEHPEPVIPRLPQVLPVDFEHRLAGVEDQGRDMTSGMSREQQVRYLDQVFSRTEPSYTNDHTGRGKGFNMIFVTAESWSPYCIDEHITPTLWHMMHDGVYFRNFYCPVWTVSTLDGECAGLCGMIPKQGVWTLKEAHKNYLGWVPGRVFERLGYTTKAYHNHTWDYYRRDLSHPNLGYDYKGLGHGLEVKRTWPESDLEMMEKTVHEFIDQEPFHVYYLTVSGHGRWSRVGNMMTVRHWDVYKDLDLPETAISYLAANYELELAMKSLLEQLRAAGIADHTLIVVNPDHIPYAMLEEYSAYEALAGKSLDDIFDIYESGALFYHDGMEPEVVDKYCTSLDLLPTIYNYMGVPFDSRMLSGRDIFSDTDALAIFLHRNWITEIGRYDTVGRNFTLHDGQHVDDVDAYVKQISGEVKLRYDTSKLIIDSDYYRDLLPEDVWAEVYAPYIEYMRAHPWPKRPQSPVVPTTVSDPIGTEPTTAASP
jgi:lipoteichoic acid synthase